jgi:hypothetical protein
MGFIAAAAHAGIEKRVNANKGNKNLTSLFILNPPFMLFNVINPDFHPLNALERKRLQTNC